MPLIIANIYHRTVRVFASRTQSPLYDVNPDLTEGEQVNMQKPILLACFAIKGLEHYDGDKPMETSTETPQKTPNRPTLPEAVTPRKKADYKSPPKKQLFRKKKC